MGHGAQRMRRVQQVVANPGIEKIAEGSLYPYQADGVAFLLSPLFGGQTLTQRMMGKAVALPAAVWRRLNLAWVLFFFAMAALNVYVFSYYDEATWVDFKLFGMLGLTLLFVVGQALFLARHLSQSQSEEGS